MNTIIKQKRKEWFVLIGLLLLCIVPVAAGIVRMIQLIAGVEITPQNARFFAAPIPVMLHIIALIPYSILGALQFVPRFRRLRPGWHRRIGWILAPCGIVVALSGLWMTLTYPWPQGDGVALYWIRLVVGVAMMLSIIFAIREVLRRDFVQHGAWMVRGYAIGMGAGTQVLTHLPWLLLMGSDVIPGESPRAVMMGAGWLINILIAEWIIRSRIQRPKQTAPRTELQSGFAAIN